MKTLYLYILACGCMLMSASTFAQQIPNTTTSETAKAYQVLGMHQMLNADLVAAKTQFDKAIELDPNYMMAHLMASVLSEGDERDQHLASAKKASMSMSAGEQALVTSFSGKEDDVELRKNARAEVMKAFPDAALPHFTAGRAHINEEGNFSEAIASFNKAASLDPAYAGPSNNQLGYLYLSTGEPNKAKVAFQEYIKLCPKDANPYDSMGDFYLEQGEYAEAKKSFDKAFAINNKFTVSETKSLQAEMSLSQGNYTKAWNKQDAEALAAMFTPDGQLFPPDAPVAVGREAITAYYKNSFSNQPAGATLSPKILGFTSSGNLAVADGKVQIELEGKVVSDLKYVATYMKQPTTGDWYVSRLCWNGMQQAVPSERE